MSDRLLDVSGVRKFYDGVPAVRHVDLTVERGSITALIGPNGAGKSTLFSVISGFEDADAGSVHFDGRRIIGWSPHRIARHGLVRTFQLTRTFRGLTVLENLLVGQAEHRGEALTGAILRPRARRADETRARERAAELLRLFDLEAKADQLGSELSGGQRKLVELARALMRSPALVLLDEPMAGVNRTLGNRLLEHISSLRDREGTTFFFVEHDLDIVARYADVVIVMANGAVIAADTPEAVLRHKAVIDAYMGT